MAHLKKFTIAAAVRMTNHYERAADDGIIRANENINHKKTCLNYNLAPDRDMCGAAYLKKILKEVYVYAGGRADTKVMCDCVVTAPKDLPKERHGKFFSEIYHFLANRYGVDDRRNIISAYVHMDETTPHLHFSFIPLVQAKAKQKEKGYEYRLCAKEVVNRQDLQTLHTDMQDYVTLHLGHHVKVITGGTVANKPMYEFKRAKLQQEIDCLVKAQEKADEPAELSRPIKRMPGIKKGVLGLATEDNEKCSVSIRELNELERKLQKLEQEKSGLQKLDQITNVLYGNLKKELEAEKKLTSELKDTAKEVNSLTRKINELEKSVRVAWQLMPPHLSRAFRVSLEDGEAISIESVRELAEAFLKASATSQSKYR